MNKKHIILSAIIGLLLGGLVGAFGYAKTAAKYDAISTACVMVNQAVENKLLAPEQIKQYGELTGTALKKNYPAVAAKFTFSQEALNKASDASNCSQFLVGFNSAK
ncbi:MULTISPECIES: hypothetical protein [Acinetobacter]|jgi:hypothetical protein|uniref:Uncharacterized protein n=1 Tax=Acinetobacter pittii TaxID=48296 RepID=A0A242U3E5_ACIPI|nr:MULTISPECIES: hypothetical protein [Acinetobacter]EXS25348.1 hypothetical protein J658_0095 [Acinetobacter baumannii 573719]MBJ8470141.1 hypothetical protein [Acinetobacter pittii]MBJ8500526.1 hypothetical protein [Acinetobacter pittii]MBJ9891268.1 hypothetical protein [Acinetobacter pittii]MCU4477810.1 hypothetical protein [Acinetobacter sp. WU_MDCI_Abxd143]